MVARLATQWQCLMHKLPLAYPLDWALGTRARRTRAWVEAKDRSTYDWPFYERHGGVFMSAMKWATARALSHATSVPFVFLVQVKDGSLWYHRPDDWSHDGVQVDAGRTDRGDWQDVEPCVLLRQSRFAPVVPELTVTPPPARVSPPTEGEMRWS
jgi:hypothetical protein